MVDQPSDLPVPLADVETAQRIADAARDGRPVDRSPTLEQLLAAFGTDPSSGPGSRVRVERALTLAGVAVSPPLTDVPDGGRVFLAPGRGPKGSGGRLRRVLLGLLVLAVLIGGATAAALTLDGDGDERVSALPAGTTAATTGTTTTAGTGSTTAATTTGTPAAAAEAEKQAAAVKAEAEKQAAAEKEAAAKKERAAETKAAADRKRAAEKKAAAERRRVVVVSVAPREPTYVCAKTGTGRTLFGGTLSSKRVFRGRTIRLNIGTSSAVVRVRGNVFRLSGSPAGVLARAGGRAPTALPSGQRPSC